MVCTGKKKNQVGYTVPIADTIERSPAINAAAQILQISVRHQRRRETLFPITRRLRIELPEQVRFLVVVNDELGGVLGRVDEGIVGGAQVDRASLLAGGGRTLRESLNINTGGFKGKGKESKKKSKSRVLTKGKEKGIVKV